jgi:hypothetical protein
MQSANHKTDSSDQLLEQYKLYVEMADRVSSRRIDANKFYISLLTALIALLSLVNISMEFTRAVFAAVAILGIILCTVWLINIRSYKQLNSLKFQVIHEMEKQLPFACYAREWQILKQNPAGKKYLRTSHVEQYIPLILLIPYIVLLFYALQF